MILCNIGIYIPLPRKSPDGPGAAEKRHYTKFLRPVPESETHPPVRKSPEGFHDKQPVPVYSYGYNPTDVRRRATLDYINKPIQINGIKITPGDLIFADECGVVVIYQKYEKEILETAIKVFINEKNIISDILDQKQVKEIMAKRGAF